MIVHIVYRKIHFESAKFQARSKFCAFYWAKGSVQTERGGGGSVKSLWIRTHFLAYFLKSFHSTCFWPWAKLRVWWLPIKVLSGSRQAHWRDVLLIHKILPAKKTKKMVIHCKKRVSFFPSKAGMSLTKLSLWLGNIKLFLARDSLVSDIPAGDGKNDNLFYSVCELYVTRSVYQIHKNERRFDKMLHFTLFQYFRSQKRFFFSVQQNFIKRITILLF